MDISERLKSARQLLDNGMSNEAFSLVIALKAEAERIPGVDLLRARCFLDQKNPWTAIEALKEELRWFPNNAEASRLLDELEEKYPAGVQSRDPLFRGFLAPVRSFTMLSEARLQHLFNGARDVCRRQIPGDFVECGVAAGGSSALLARCIKEFSKTPRRLYSCDTFEGMPTAGAVDKHQGVNARDTGWGEGTCAAPIESLREAADCLGVGDLIEPVKGLFRNTLPQLRSRLTGIALLHMDGDWYESTMDILNNLYDWVSPGGYIQIDDYGFWEGCRKAVHEFEQTRGLTFKLTRIDDTGMWMQKQT